MTISGRLNDINNRYDNLFNQVQTKTGTATWKSELERFDAEKAALDAKEDEVNQTYNVTDEGDDKPSAIDIINTILTGAAGLLSAAAPFFSEGNHSDIAGFQDPVAGGLDGATQAYLDNPSSKNKMKLESALAGAEKDLGSVTEAIGTINKENPALEKAAKGDFTDILSQIGDGLAKSLQAISDNQKTIDGINGDLGKINTAIGENDQATINVTQLSDATKEVLGKQEGEVTIKVKQQEGQNKTLSELMEAFNNQNKKVEDDETNIATATDNLGQAKNDLADANGSLSAAQSMPATVKETAADGSTKEVPNKERDTKIKEAEKKVKDAEAKVKKQEDALAKAKGQKEKDEAKLKEIGSSIEIGEKTLADIVAARSEAEAARDKAQGQVDDYAVQLKGYAANAEQLGIQFKTGTDAATRNEAYRTMLTSQQNDLTKIDVDAKKGKESAQNKLNANNKILEGLNARKDALTPSINKAKQALGTSSADGNSTLPGGNEGNSTVTGGNEGNSTVTGGNEGNSTVTGGGTPPSAPGNDQIDWTGMWNKPTSDGPAWNPPGFGGGSGDQDFDKFAADYRREHGMVISDEEIRKAYEESKKAET